MDPADIPIDDINKALPNSENKLMCRKILSSCAISLKKYAANDPAMIEAINVPDLSSEKPNNLIFDKISPMIIKPNNVIIESNTTLFPPITEIEQRYNIVMQHANFIDSFINMIMPTVPNSIGNRSF